MLPMDFEARMAALNHAVAVFGNGDHPPYAVVEAAYNFLFFLTGESDEVLAGEPEPLSVEVQG